MSTQKPYKSIGSVEGRPEAMFEHTLFSLTESRTGGRVFCRLPTPDDGTVFEALKDQRRIVASGTLLHKANGDVIGVTIDRPLRLLKLESELPTIDDLCGSDPDFTGGLSTEEYLRDMRG